MLICACVRTDPLRFDNVRNFSSPEKTDSPSLISSGYKGGILEDFPVTYCHVSCCYCFSILLRKPYCGNFKDSCSLSC